MNCMSMKQAVLTACKGKVLDALLLDGGGQRGIIPLVTNYVIKIIIK